MTHETKMEIKRDYYAKAREKAAMCMTAMGAKPKDGVEPNSWEGMMSMAEYVLGHKPTDAEVASTMMAAARWNAAELECGKYDAMKAAREMIDREVAAAQNGGEGANGDASHEQDAATISTGTATSGVRTMM